MGMSTSVVNENKRMQARFGRNVRPKLMECSKAMKIVSIVMAILVIPLQLFFTGVVQDWENEAVILPLQEKLAISTDDPLNGFMSSPIYLFNARTTVFFMMSLYMFTDSLIAYTTAFTTCIGIYILAFLNLLFKDGRPFWTSA